MCGRYAFFSPAEAVRRTFALDDVPALEPRYNVAPTQDVPAVRAGEEGARAFAMLHWGLVPKWAKERAIGNRMINARAETHRREAVVPRRIPEAPLPGARRRLVRVAGRARAASSPGSSAGRTARPFAFAGLWERWKDPADGAMLESCTIVTTDAAATIRKIHDRMPVVLAEADWDRWLDTAFSDTETLSGAAEALRARMRSRPGR